MTAEVPFANEVVSSDEAIMSTVHVRRAYTRLHAAGLRVSSADKVPKAHEIKTVLQLCAREHANVGTLLCQPRTSARVPLEILSVVAVEVNKWVEAARNGDTAAIERRRASTTLIVVPTGDDVPRWFNAARTHFPTAAGVPANNDTATTMQVAGILLAGVLAPGDTYAVDGTTLVQRGRPTTELLDAYDVLIVPQIVLHRLMGVPALCAEYDAIMARLEQCVRGETTYGAVCSSVDKEKQDNYGAFVMHKNHDREAPLYFNTDSTRLPALFARQWHRVVVDDAHEVLAGSLRSTTSRALFALRAKHWCGVTEQAQSFDTNATMAWAMLVRLLQIATFVPLHVLLQHLQPPTATDTPRRHVQHDKIRQWCALVVRDYQMEVMAPAQPGAAVAVAAVAAIKSKVPSIAAGGEFPAQIALQPVNNDMERAECHAKTEAVASTATATTSQDKRLQCETTVGATVVAAAETTTSETTTTTTTLVDVPVDVPAVAAAVDKSSAPPSARRRRGRPDDDDDDDDNNDHDDGNDHDDKIATAPRSTVAATAATAAAAASTWRPAAGRVYDCPFSDQHACTFEELLRHAQNPHKQDGTEPDPISVKVHAEFLCQIADGASYETACLLARLHLPPRSSRADRNERSEPKMAPVAPKRKYLIKPSKVDRDDDDDDDDDNSTDETVVYNDSTDGGGNTSEDEEEGDKKPTCMCRKPWEMVPGLMIECSACAEWFHVTCLRAHGDVPKHWSEKRMTKSNVLFVCSVCNQEPLGKFVDKQRQPKERKSDAATNKKKKKKRARQEEMQAEVLPAKRAKEEETIKKERDNEKGEVDDDSTSAEAPTATTTLPLTLNSRQTLLTLGTIPDRARKAFFTERYVYPIGYRSLYRHKGNVYVCEILDGLLVPTHGGGKDRPVFRVRRGETTREWHTSTASTGAVTAAVKGTSTARRSGPEFFSLTNGVVQRLLQQAMRATRKRPRRDDDAVDDGDKAAANDCDGETGDQEQADSAGESVAATAAVAAATAAAAAAVATAAAAAAVAPPSRVAKLDQRVAERVCKAFSSTRTVRQRIPHAGGGAQERTLDVVYVDHIVDFATRIERNFHDACLATTSTRGTAPPTKRLKVPDGAIDKDRKMAEQEVFGAMLATISVSALRAQRGDDFLAHNQVVRNGLATKALPTVSTKLAEMVRYVQQRVRDGERAIVLSEWYSTLVEAEKALERAGVSSAMRTGDEELDAAPQCLLVPIGSGDTFGDGADCRLPPANHILFAHPLLDARQSAAIVRNIVHPSTATKQFVVHFMIADTCDELVRHHATNERLDRHGVLCAVADDVTEQQLRAERAASVRGVPKQ